MARRSIPSAKTDDTAFPGRMWLWAAGSGFQLRTCAMYDWLDALVGRGDYARHPCGVVGARDAVALYFRMPSDADAFLRAFPDLELADGTQLDSYSSPRCRLAVSLEDEPVCNLYNHTRAQDAIR